MSLIFKMVLSEQTIFCSDSNINEYKDNNCKLLMISWVTNGLRFQELIPLESKILLHVLPYFYCFLI